MPGKKEGNVEAPFRVMTANVQSFPVRAITPGEALEDLRKNAADADLVFLQEIVARYRPLVSESFAAPDWEVYYGKTDNHEPIAFRTDLFSKVAGQAIQVHPANSLHDRRYTTHLRLRYKPLGTDLHATNLHLVAGAYNAPHMDDDEERKREWDTGIEIHRDFIESLVQTRLPVVGGGDYNRQLRQCKALGSEIDGRRVRYAVDKGSIDLLWFIDGDDAAWDVRSTKVYPGRRWSNPERHSDHSARSATVLLGDVEAPIEVPKHPPFQLTEFGDKTPKRMDWKTRAALEVAQRRLGYPLTIVQGCYNQGAVSASAGTHDGGGVVDLIAYDRERKVRVLREIGFAAWYRPTIKGLWGEHIHAVLIDHGRLASSAARQVDSYRRGRDGLKGDRSDPTWRPKPISVFVYPPPAAPSGTPSGPPPDVVQPTSVPFPPRRTLDGVDTSHYQGGRIDVKAAQAAGLKFWYLKTTEGDSIVDRTYKSRIRQARQAGVPVGSYHFARPDLGDAGREALFFLSNADIRAGDMIPMLDLESLEGLSPTQVTSWAGTWVATVTKELTAKGLSAKPIIYTRFDLGSGFGCYLWVARYSNDKLAPRIPKPWRKAVIWQHSDGRYGPIKHVPGFGAVDVNALHPDIPLSALRIRRVGVAPSPGSPVPPTRPGRPHRPPDQGGGPRPQGNLGLEAVLDELRAGVKSMQSALDKLPKR